ncbi:hypothetical protein [Shewanella sp. Isolate11]|uniref:hypothetical protein n=1 Tax=Shewanella sp. Isolate11 TaxID=2908530 RepID=UPI001EFEBFF4|nr:hypothetical protein [Shewanella sp. Isolate11]MCG9695760.1 hypothetical protein [Shewanella sp. Isolate11]
MIERKAIVFLCVLLSACGSDNEKQSEYFEYEFIDSNVGFEFGTTNHDVTHELNNTIKSNLAKLPSPYEYREGVLFEWDNYSSSIQGFMKTKIKGLHPNKKFSAEFNVDVLTSASLNCVGVGGVPGFSEKVKAGFFNIEPKKIIYTKHINGVDVSHYEINIENSLVEGSTADLGHLGLDVECKDERPWELKSLSNDELYTFKSDENGEAWLYIEIKSGFAGFSSYYVLSAEAMITQL